MPKSVSKPKPPPFYRVVVVAVGVETYQNPPTQAEIRSVDWATKDASALASTFRSIFDGECEVDTLVFLDKDASLTTLKRSLSKTIQGLSANDLFVFFYAGHGFQAGGENWLTAWDSDPDELNTSSVQLAAEVLTPLKKSACRKALVFIDACAEDMTDAASRSLIKNLTADEIEEYLDESDYVGVYLSCSAGQKAWGSPELGHGVFTWHLLQALEGNAPDALLEDRWLTDVSLRDWLDIEVSKWVRLKMTGKSQTPQAVLTANRTFRIRQVPETLLKPVMLADLALPNLNACLEGVETGAIRSLDLKPGNSPPKYVNDKGARFIAGLLKPDLIGELDSISKATRERYNLARSDAKPEWDDTGGGIVAPLFTYSIGCEQIEDDLNQYLIRRQLTLNEGWEAEAEGLAEIFTMVEFSTVAVDVDKRRLHYEEVADRLDALKRSGSGDLDEDTDTKRLTYSREGYTIVVDGKAGRVEIEHDEKVGMELAAWARTLDLGWTYSSEMLLAKGSATDHGDKRP